MNYFQKKKLPISEQLSPVANLDFSKYLNVRVSQPLPLQS
jgi:hypothetical protein